ncbi:MAG: AMP-dependent synthetase [Sedimenticola sp.]|nr:MAG: AMP-dependent synthetase [Sedimenticola sp.]
MLITEILARNARMYPAEVALVEREPAKNSRREITWNAFDQDASRFANALMLKGVRKGDKVVHLLMNCLEWLPTYFGIQRTGAWAVPLNFRFEADIILACSLLAEPKVFVFGEEFVERITEIKHKLDKTVRHYVFIGADDACPDFADRYADFIREASNQDPAVAMEITDEAAIYFTSGTTGLPKGVLLTHRCLEHAAYVENRHHNQTHEDNFLCIPPLYHTGAKMHWLGGFIVGARAVILKGAKPQWILEAISEERATIVWLLVPWAHDILIAYENGDLDFSRYRMGQWRLMHIGAQPVPPNLIRAWKKLFPHHQYDTNYGLTECTGPGCVHLGIENTHKIGSIGIPGFDWECRIVDFDGNNLPDGEPGELLVKGPGVMKEYYNNPEASRETVVDGWLHTGDIARKDAEGFYWLVDRKKDLIITGGENVSPVEVEHFFMAHPAIQDIGVIGTPDMRLGEVVTAIIQVKPGKSLSEAEVLAFAEELPRYKRPRIIFFDEVPRNATGKIEKPRLREKFIK